MQDFMVRTARASRPYQKTLFAPDIRSITHPSAGSGRRGDRTVYHSFQRADGCGLPFLFLQLPHRRMKVTAHDANERGQHGCGEERGKHRPDRRMCHSVCSPANPNNEQSEKSGQTEDPGDRHEVMPENIAFLATRQPLGPVGGTSPWFGVIGKT